MDFCAPYVDLSINSYNTIYSGIDANLSTKA